MNEVEGRSSDLLLGLLGSGECMVQPLQLAREALVEHHQEQLLLAPEVGVERALRVAGGLGDLVDGRPLKAVPAEDPCRRREQRLARPLLALPARETHVSTTSASWLGVSVIARLSTRSDSVRAGSSRRRLTSSLSTARISNCANAAPMHRRTPPPNGIQV